MNKMGELKDFYEILMNKMINLINHFDGIESEILFCSSQQNLLGTELRSIHEELLIAIKNIKKMIKDFNEFINPVNLTEQIGDINEIIQKEISQMRLPAEIQIEPEFDLDLPTINIDKNKVSDIIKEILNFFLRRINNNGAQGIIRINTFKNQNQNNSILINISDTGPHFPRYMSIFEPFQIDGPNVSGLELSIVKKKIEAHNASINCLEEPGRGICFEISFPNERIRI